MPTENEANDLHRPGILATMALLVGIVPFMAGLFGLYGVLGIGMPYFGLLFLLYWASILRQDFGDYLPSVLGGLGGILLGWTQVAMPELWGTAGQAASILILVVTLFCFMRGHVPVIVNNATMLFALVSTIAELNIRRNVLTMAASLAVAAIYMGLIAVVVRRVMRHRRTSGDRSKLPT